MTSRGWFLSQDLRHSSKILGGLKSMETTETSLLEKRGSSETGKGSYLELYRDVTLLSAAPQAL